jgi:hypothetical protein
MRRQRTRWIVVGWLVVALLLPGCGGSSEEATEEAAIVEEVQGADVSRITLTPEAVERLGIKTAAVEENGGGTVIPYSAVLYSPTGETWAYVNPEPFIFIRDAIVVEQIDGDRAVLSAGPDPGTKVATVGVPELFGAESGIGGEQMTQEGSPT